MKRDCYCCEKEIIDPNQPLRRNTTKGPAIFLDVKIYYCQKCLEYIRQYGRFLKLKDLPKKI